MTLVVIKWDGCIAGIGGVFTDLDLAMAAAQDAIVAEDEVDHKVYTQVLPFQENERYRLYGQPGTLGALATFTRLRNVVYLEVNTEPVWIKTIGGM